MAEAVLAVFGASATIIQLSDASLKLCRHISEFAGELQDAKGDIDNLRKTLDDTSSLIRSLTEMDHERLPQVIVYIREFHGILTSLRKCLPPDLTPSFSQRFRFVFRKKKIILAMKQLEACKISASLALNIFSKVEGSQILSAVQGVSRQQEHIFAAISEMTTQVQSVQLNVDARRFHPEWLRVNETIPTTDEDTPNPDRETTGKVDDPSSCIETQAHYDMGLDRKFSKVTNVTTQTEQPVGVSEIDSCTKRSIRQIEIHVSKPSEYTRSTWTTVMLRTVKLRCRRAHINSSSASYFTIEIDIIPHGVIRWLVPMGVSLSYTNMPDDAGYYSICPRILTFSLIPKDAPVWDVIREDDADALQRMIMNREVGVRDCTESGTTLLKEALRYRSMACSRYLLSGTALSRSALLEIENIHDMAQFSAQACVIHVYTGSEGYNHHVEEFFEGFQDRDAQRLKGLLRMAMEYGLGSGVVDLGSMQRWVKLWRRFSEPGRVYDTHSYLRHIRDFNHGYAWVKDHLEFWVHFCWKRGGDLNDVMESWDGGMVPLEYAIGKAARGLAPDCPDELWCELDCTVVKTYRLMSVLIAAGADVSNMREVNGRLRSLTDLATEKGVKDQWEEALRECGYDPVDVRKEDARRRLAAVE